MLGRLSRLAGKEIKGGRLAGKEGKGDKVDEEEERQRNDTGKRSPMAG